ncbi:MAG TPA: hypothetical protein VLV84_01445 [Candidatus Acidoferrales bacterium]|nr:hypothetical protein [Candidatus Acidoferrales bacterium]
MAAQGVYADVIERCASLKCRSVKAVMVGKTTERTLIYPDLPEFPDRP